MKRQSLKLLPTFISDRIRNLDNKTTNQKNYNKLIDIKKATGTV